MVFGEGTPILLDRHRAYPIKHLHVLLALSEVPLPDQFLLVLQVSNQALLPSGNFLAIQPRLGTGFFHHQLV